MFLHTLGGIELEGAAFGREKLLLLLAYLAIEGPQHRRSLAELFWPHAANPTNSLASALVKLRPLGLTHQEGEQIWADLECDVQKLQQSLRNRNWLEATQQYRGAFAQGLALGEIESDLEEWVYATREGLAREVRMALLQQAEQQAAAGQFSEAAELAERAYRLSGAPPLEPEELVRLHRLLLAANHPLRVPLGREGQELGLTLASDAEAARGQLRRSWLGRERESEQLLALRSGQWAWVSGSLGMGKTSLLRELEGHGWRYLPARSGLPFATLEPLLDKLEGGLEVILRRVAAGQTNLLFDDWEHIDPESQEVLQRLSRLRPEFCVVIAASGPPAFGDVQLELGPLSPQELVSAPGAYEATDGIPSLVGSWLRSEPLEGALENRLNHLSRATLELYGALALLEEPDPALARRALGLEAQVTAGALETLLAAGLIEPSGRVRAKQAALNYLDANPTLGSSLALVLARNLGAEQSLPLYRRSRGLWEEADFGAVSKAYLQWSHEMLRRGFPLKAAELLQEAPQTYDVKLALARAHERAGRNHIVIELLVGLPETPETLALQLSVWVRYGEMEKAKEAALKAIGGTIDVIENKGIDLSA